MFFDWVTVVQDHGFKLPIISDTSTLIMDMITGEMTEPKGNSKMIEGSYSTKCYIKVRDSRIEMSFNPSKYNRLDNLFGYTHIDAAMQQANNILKSLELPLFTKSTYYKYTQSKTDKHSAVSDGAKFIRIDVTHNMCIGEGNEEKYLRAISSLDYGHLQGYLYPNGATVDFKSKSNISKASQLTYPKIYSKYHELQLRTSKNYLKKQDEQDQNYLFELLQYVKTQGVLRFEIELKSKKLARKKTQYWGTFNNEELFTELTEFIEIHKRLRATTMNHEILKLQLINERALSERQATTTVGYYLAWISGESFDASKSHIKRHRANLRALGFDICRPFDLTRNKPIIINEACNELTIKPLTVPDFYRKPRTALLGVA